MVLQHSSVGSPYLGTLAITIILLNAKVGTFPLSYAVIPSFISCFTTFCCLDPYFILKIVVEYSPVNGYTQKRDKVHCLLLPHTLKLDRRKSDKSIFDTCMKRS